MRRSVQLDSRDCIALAEHTPIMRSAMRSIILEPFYGILHAVERPANVPADIRVTSVKVRT